MSEFWFEKSFSQHDAAMRTHFVEYDIPTLPRWVGIKVMWPFAGAFARVLFYVKGQKECWVSTYLDVNDALGVMGCPYFEAYPICGDTYRVKWQYQEHLYGAVVAELKRQRWRAKKEKKNV